MTRGLRWLRWLLHHHQWELRLAPGRLWLACTTCPAQTAGWTLNAKGGSHV
jgi:hypothetical protein